MKSVVLTATPPAGATVHAFPGDADPLDLIDADDPLQALSMPTRRAIVAGLGITSTSDLLRVSDRQISLSVKEGERCGPGAVAEVQRWLSAQRLKHGELPSSPIAVKSRVEDLLNLAKHDIAQAVRSVIQAQRLKPEEVARQAGTSREAVVSLLAGSVPASLELALRLAVVVGVPVRVSVGTGLGGDVVDEQTGVVLRR